MLTPGPGQRMFIDNETQVCKRGDRSSPWHVEHGRGMCLCSDLSPLAHEGPRHYVRSSSTWSGTARNSLGGGGRLADVRTGQSQMRGNFLRLEKEREGREASCIQGYKKSHRLQQWGKIEELRWGTTGKHSSLPCQHRAVRGAKKARGPSSAGGGAVKARNHRKKRQWCTGPENHAHQGGEAREEDFETKTR